MKQIDHTDEKVGDAQKQQVMITDVPAGIPRKDKDGESDDDTEDFGKTVKKKIVFRADEIENPRDCRPDQRSNRVPSVHQGEEPVIYEKLAVFIHTAF